MNHEHRASYVQKHQPLETEELPGMTRKSASDVESLRRKVASLEKENKQLRKLVSESKRIPKYVPPPSTINEGTILSFGLSLVGIPKWQTCCARLKMRRFRSHFGVGPRAIVALVSDMKRTQNKPINLTYLFVAISWLKIYETEEQMAGRWGYGEQHCRETVLDYVKRIQAMKKWKISFRRISKKSRFLPVDTVHLRCQEFRCTPDSKWYSFKFSGPGVAFEVVSDPDTGYILWMNGPEPANIDDCVFLRGGKKDKPKSTWKRSALYFHIPSGVKLVGDSAYSSQPDKVTTTKDAHDPKTKKLFARMKSMQETCFKRFKDFKVLRESFRHGTGTDNKLEKIKTSFEAVAVLVQYDIENGHPLFEV